MATEIKLPDLGEGIVDVTVSRWRVPVGTAVKAGEVILEVATDKVDTEVAAPADGVLLQVNFSAGELAPVSGCPWLSRRGRRGRWCAILHHGAGRCR